MIKNKSKTFSRLFKGTAAATWQYLPVSFVTQSPLVVGTLPRLGPNLFTARTRNLKFAQGVNTKLAEVAFADVTFLNIVKIFGSKVDSCSIRKCVIGESLDEPITQVSVVDRSLQSVISKLVGGSGTPEMNNILKAFSSIYNNSLYM